MFTPQLHRIRVASNLAVVSNLTLLVGCSSSSSSPDGSSTPVDGGLGPTLDGGSTSQLDSSVGHVDSGGGTADGGSGDVSVDAQPDGGPIAISIAFDAHVGAVTFTCAAGTTYPNLGIVPSNVTVSDFRFYVHDVSLVRADGTTEPVVLTQDGVWQYENVALLDFEDGTGNCSDGTAATNAVVQGTVSAGSYTGVTFKLGVPFSLDHGDPASAPSPLNVDGMTWGWQYGYKYWRNDSQSTATVPVADAGVDASAPVPAFFVHIGATGCVGDPTDGGVVSSCANPNVAIVNLPGFDFTKNKIVADFAAVVAYSNLDVNGGGAPGCMSDPSDPECPSVFQAFGLVLETGLPANPSLQTAFRIE